ncbi:hypothetical protein GCM10010517_71850 [Streptosporangium fragile]|uniref:RNA polymerase sigma factor n=1 Tax=Streptosporangium fragile TaxID=46186 RepID=A0ABN3W8N7_9ACTN
MTTPRACGPSRTSGPSRTDGRPRAGEPSRTDGRPRAGEPSRTDGPSLTGEPPRSGEPFRAGEPRHLGEPPVAGEPDGLGTRFRAGDESALRQVQERYGRALFATALNLLGDPGLAEEAVQDALVRAWRGAGHFDASRELAPWLYRIVRRCAVDVHRRHSRHPATAPLDELPAALEAVREVPAERLWTVRSAVRRLEPPQREVVELLYYDGLTHRDVADRLGIPLGTVKSRVFRAHRHLGELLGSAPRAAEAAGTGGPGGGGRRAGSRGYRR